MEGQCEERGRGGAHALPFVDIGELAIESSHNAMNELESLFTHPGPCACERSVQSLRGVCVRLAVRIGHPGPQHPNPEVSALHARTRKIRINVD